MAVSVEFFAMTKRINSTKAPNHTTDVFMTESCVLKEPVSVIRPVLRLKIASSMGSPDVLNYCYISAFTRFYWVNDWVNISNDIWECVCVEDFLASWKMAIGAANKYVLRSSSNWTGDLIDTHYPAEVTRFQLENSGWTAPFNVSNSTYVLGIIGKGSNINSMGAVQYYAFTQAQLVDLFDSIFSSNAWLNISTADLSDELQKAFINPYQYISSAVLFPFDVTSTTGASSVTTVNFGWWTLNTGAYMLSKAPVKLIGCGDGTIPKHPQAASRGIYLNNEPYSMYMIYIPGVGYQKLEAGALQGADKLGLTIYVDLITGMEKVYLSPYDSSSQQYLRELTPLYGQAGIPIELAQIGRGPLEAAIHGLSQIASTALQSFGGPIANTLSGIVSAVGSSLLTVQSKGSTGSTLDYQYPNYWPKLYNWYSRVADQDLQEVGAPLCQTTQIFNLSGYVLCQDGELDTNGLLEEKQEIARYLTTGFYYE